MGDMQNQLLLCAAHVVAWLAAARSSMPSGSVLAVCACYSCNRRGLTALGELIELKGACQQPITYNEQCQPDYTLFYVHMVCLCPISAMPCSSAIYLGPL